MVKVQLEPFAKVSFATAAEIARLVDLSAEARAYLLPELSPQGYLDLLVLAELTGDAIRFLAFALPIREAVWWACVAVHGTVRSPGELETKCVQRAAAWVYEPGEDRRRACMEVAEAAKFEGAAAYVALSVFWSGGSLAPEGLPDALPDPRLGPIGAAAAILLALSAGDPAGLHKRFTAVMQRGLDIANGGNGWLKDDLPLIPAA